MEYLKMSMWLFAVWNLILIKFSSGSIVTKYKTRENCRIGSGAIMQTSSSFDSFTACTISCRDKTGCISVSWNSQTSNCLFSSVDTSAEYNDVWRPYEQAAGWMCATQRVYPVFALLKTTYTNSYHEMTFEEAIERCAEYRTSLASADDVTTAQSLGLNFCQCGWLEGGGNALIVPEADPNCASGRFNIGPIWCNRSLANAWCRF